MPPSQKLSQLKQDIATLLDARESARDGFDTAHAAASASSTTSLLRTATALDIDAGCKKALMALVVPYVQRLGLDPEQFFGAEPFFENKPRDREKIEQRLWSICAIALFLAETKSPRVDWDV